MPNLITQYLIEMNQIDDSIRHKLQRIQDQEDFRESNQKLFDSLTKREVEIISLVTKDFNNLQISEKLFISRYTVEQHRKNINKKLEINNAIQLFQFALSFNLV